MTDEEVQMLSARVPVKLKHLVHKDLRDNQDVVRHALRREFGSDEQARLEMRLEHRRDQRDMLERERKQLVDQIQSLEEEIAALESQINHVETTDQDYCEDLDDLIDEMLDVGMSVWPGHGKVQDIATQHDTDPKEVVDDLRERASEIDAGLPDHRFEDGNGGPFDA